LPSLVLFVLLALLLPMRVVYQSAANRAANSSDANADSELGLCCGRSDAATESAHEQHRGSKKEPCCH